MSLFANPTEHVANPPESWEVHKHGRKWGLVIQGHVLQYFKTMREATAAKSEGFHFDLYQKETRWYAGENVPGWRPYKPADVKGGAV